MQAGHKTHANALAMCRSWFIGLPRFIAVRAGAFYWHRFGALSSGALWRCSVGLGSFVLSVLFLAIKASSANSLCVAVVIVRAVRAAVVIINSCQSVPSIKRVAGQF